MANSQPERKYRRLLIALAAGIAVAGAGLVTYSRITKPRTTDAFRGRLAFAKYGCDGCHGPGGSGGVPNPQSRERDIPGFVGGTAMMYVESVAEIREWILDGRPARLDESPAGGNALVTMPAFRGRISETELNDLVAYYQAVAWYEPGLPEDAKEGRRVAGRLGCFGCHGPAGRAGVENPGSFKGYVPGWGSDDFLELVESEQELREWILNGSSKRFATNNMAQQFLTKQVIRMPAYRDVISDDDADRLVSYIQWLARPKTTERSGAAGVSSP